MEISKRRRASSPRAIRVVVVAGDPLAQVAAIRAGVDSNCGTVFPDELYGAIERGEIEAAELLPAVTRLLEQRVVLGLLDDWDASAGVPRPGIDVVDSDDHRALAQRAARESVVLLSNDGGVLPLTADGRALAVVGPMGDASMNLLSGYHGQAPPDLLQSPVAALTARWPGAVTYAAGCNASDAPDADPAVANASLSAAVAVAAAADVVVLGLGLCGDNYDGGPPLEDATCFLIDEAETRDRTTVALPGRQMDLFRRIRALGKPTVVFLLHAGAVDVAEIRDAGVAIVDAGYGAEYGGEAIADALLGVFNPGGALSATVYPTASLPRYRDMSLRPSATSPGRTYRFLDESIVAPVWRFGFGLSYTNFTAALANASSQTVRPDEALPLTVTVANVGDRSGDVVVCCYASAGDALRSEYDAPLRELFDFERVRDLAPGASTSLGVVLPPSARSLVAADGARILPETGSYSVSCEAGGVATTATVEVAVGA